MCSAEVEHSTTTTPQEANQLKQQPNNRCATGLTVGEPAATVNLTKSNGKWSGGGTAIEVHAGGCLQEGAQLLESPAFGFQYQANPRVRDLSRLAML